MRITQHHSLVFVVMAAAIAAILIVVPGGAQTTFPDPKDEAKLYEAAKKEGKLVWYESAPLEPMKTVAAEFEKTYPGIRVETLRIVGVQQYQRFLQETQAKQYINDIVHISDYPSMEALIRDGHLVDWKVPTSDRIPETFRMNNYAYAPYPSDLAIVYHVNKLKPEEVEMLRRDWKAVTDPRFKGRFAVTTMKCGVCYTGVHMFLDPKLKDRFGPEFLKQVAAQKPAMYAEVLVALDRVVAGEHDFGYWLWEAPAVMKFEQGAPIRWLFPEPTPVLANTWQGISKYAPHPNAARLFQNWTMSEKGALVLQQKYGSRPVLTGLADTREITKASWYVPIKTRYDVDFKRWAENYHKDMDLWIKTLQAGR